MTPVEQITSLYIGYFGRAPDPEGLDYWVGRLADGFSLAEIAESFSVQAESQTKYPYLSNPNIASPQAFITQVYLNLFNRVPDAEGLAYWTAQLEGGADVGDFILDVISGAVTDPDQQIIENKIEVGADFALKAANEPGFVYDADAANAAVEVINGVDETDASVVEGKAESDAFFDMGPAPTPFVLTTAVDNLVGTDGADTINGVVATVANGGTFNTGDAINGGAGEDTLSLIITDGSTIVPSSITNVETIEVQDFDGGTINLANAVGVQTIAATGSEYTTEFDNVGNLVDIELNDIDGGVGLEINFDASVVAGDDDAISVLVSNADTELDVSGVEVLNVTVSGAADGDEGNYLDLNSSITTMNIVGAGNLEVEDFNSNLNTVDASAATGDLDLDFGYTGDITVTSGAGDDVFEFDGSLTVDDAVDGGEGVDTVTVSVSGDLSSAASAAPFNALTSVERVEFDAYSYYAGSVGVTLNGATFTNSSITNILFNTAKYGAGDANDVVNNAGSARTYEFGRNNNGSATFAMNGTSTVLNIALLGNESDDANVEGLTVELSGTQPASAVSTINVNSVGEDQINDLGLVTARAGSTINITGDAATRLQLDASSTVNASASTGGLIIEGSEIVAAVAEVVGVDANADGDFADVGDTAPVAGVAFNSGADTITLGAGDDLITFSSALDSGTDNDTAGATVDALFVDVVNGFEAGAEGDVLDFTGTGGDADYTAISADDQAEISALAGAGATLQAAADIAADFVTADEWTAFTFQGQTYAMYSGDADTDYEAGTDLLVQITGVTVSGLTDDNFA